MLVFMFLLVDMSMCMYVCVVVVFFFQAEDGIRDLVRSRGLGDVYKRQELLRLSIPNFLQDFTVCSHLPITFITFATQAVDLSLIHI